MIDNFSRLSDEELISLVKTVDVFGELQKRYQYLVDILVGKIVVYHGLDTDDLYQEGLLGLYNSALTYNVNSGASFKTYASVCISNRLKNACRKQNSKKNSLLNNSLSLDDVPHVETSKTNLPEVQLETNETIEEMSKQIHISLSDFERKVLMLTLSGTKREEIAKSLNITVKSLDNAIGRVRKKLKNSNI